MASYFFPLLWLSSEPDRDQIGNGRIMLHRRRWDVSIFDLYSLVAQKHPIGMPAEILSIFLNHVNLEIEIIADNIEVAKEVLNILRSMMSINGVAPTIAPFASSVSINKYAGINDRSSGNQSRMHEGLREGITHDDTRIEMWIGEMHFSRIIGDPKTMTQLIENKVFEKSVSDTEVWIAIESKNGLARAARESFVKAPLLPDNGSSLLHLWQGIESLFPGIHAEVTFRTSLLLAELTSPVLNRIETYDNARKSYGDRSKIAHGSRSLVTTEKWTMAWVLLRNALNAVLERGELPKEEQLTKDLLER